MKNPLNKLALDTEFSDSEIEDNVLGRLQHSLESRSRLFHHAHDLPVSHDAVAHGHGHTMTDWIGDVTRRLLHKA